MYYAYVLRSVEHPKQKYIGSTNDLKKRIAQHNDGKSIHTNKFKPWMIEMYFAFSTLEVATRFEKYLKSGSGRAFAARHFGTNSNVE